MFKGTPEGAFCVWYLSSVYSQWHGVCVCVCVWIFLLLCKVMHIVDGL